MAQLSGEKEVMGMKYRVPLLKFNGKTGKFSLMELDQNGKLQSRGQEWDEVEGVILKVRRVLGSWEFAGDQLVTLFSNEHNSWRDEIVLFEKREGTPKIRMIDQGPSRKLRDKYKNLKMIQNLYFLFEDQVVKLPVKGKSLGSLFEYYETLSGRNEHIWQFITKIQSHSDSRGSIDFFVMDFLKQEEADLEIVSAKIEEVARKLDLQDKSFAERPMLEDEIRGEDEMSSKETENTEPDKEEKIDDGEVKIEDIPF